MTKRPLAGIQGMTRSPRAPDPVDLLVARNIRIQRIIKGMSQGEIADRLGITCQQL
jgi:DNA-binding CsgD family transcriptional regulator